MKLRPLNNNVSLVELKSKELKELTGKHLVDVEAAKMNVLNYGQIVESSSKDYKAGDIVLYQKLASHKTNFGTPRQLLVPITEIEGRLDD